MATRSKNNDMGAEVGKDFLRAHDCALCVHLLFHDIGFEVALPTRQIATYILRCATIE